MRGLYIVTLLAILTARAMGAPTNLPSPTRYAVMLERTNTAVNGYVVTCYKAAGVTNFYLSPLAGGGDMTRAVYDPLNHAVDIFDYTDTATNSLWIATTNWVLGKAYVTASITNTFAKTNWVISYVAGQINTATNSLWTSITNWVMTEVGAGATAGSNAWVWTQANSNKVAYMASWTNQYANWSNSWKWVQANSSAVARVFTWTNNFALWSNTVTWIGANSNALVRTNDASRTLNWLSETDVLVPSPLTSNSAVRKAYVDENVLGESDWYINGSASADIAGYLQMRRTNSLSSITNSYLNVTNNQYLSKHITILGQPNEPFIEQGLWAFSFYAYKQNIVGKTATVIAELWLRNAAGSEYAEVAESSGFVLTATKTQYTAYFDVQTNTTTALTDRWVVKIRVSASASTPDVYVVAGGPLHTHLSAKTSPTTGLNRHGDTLLGRMILAANIDGGNTFTLTNAPQATASNWVAQWGQVTNWVLAQGYSTGGSGSQTPITNNVDYARYALTNASLIFGTTGRFDDVWVADDMDVGGSMTVSNTILLLTRGSDSNHAVRLEHMTNYVKGVVATATNAIYNAATNAAFTAAKGMTNSIIGNATNKAKAYADATFVQDTKTNDIIALATNSAKAYTDAATNTLHTHIGTDISTATNNVFKAATNASFTAAKGLTNSIIAGATNKAKAYTDSRYTVGTNWAAGQFVKLNETRNTTNSGRMKITNLMPTSTFTNGNAVGQCLKNSVVVTLTTAQTAAQKQAVIDSYPKNLNGYTLSFTLAAGTHTNEAVLTFDDFYGGSLVIGGAAAPSARTNQTTKIFYTTASFPAILVTRVYAGIVIQNLMVRNTLDASTRICLQVSGCPAVSLSGCYFLNTAGSTAQYHEAFRCDNKSHMEVYTTFVRGTSFDTAVAALYASQLFITTSMYTNAAPVVGYYAIGGQILRGDANTMGTTDNQVVYGGEIITSAGDIEP